MRIELAPGEELVVGLKDTDGEFTVKYGEAGVSVSADLPDSSGRAGIIYCEEFGAFLSGDDVDVSCQPS